MVKLSSSPGNSSFSLRIAMRSGKYCDFSLSRLDDWGFPEEEEKTLFIAKPEKP